MGTFNGAVNSFEESDCAMRLLPSTRKNKNAMCLVGTVMTANLCNKKTEIIFFENAFHNKRLTLVLFINL
jgi:hypothetical protein